jgi:hypothetical protein
MGEMEGRKREKLEGIRFWELVGPDNEGSKEIHCYLPNCRRCWCGLKSEALGRGRS